MIKQPSASLPQSSNVAQQPATRIQHTNPIPPVSPMSEAQQVLVPPTTPVINPISQPGISHPGITYANLNVPSTPRLMPAPEGTPSIPNTIVSTRQDNYQQKSWRRALATFKTSPSHRIIIILIVLLFLLPGVIAVITSNHLQQIDQEQHTTATAKAMVLTATATASNPTAVAIRATAQTMA